MKVLWICQFHWHVLKKKKEWEVRVQWKYNLSFKKKSVFLFRVPKQIQLLIYCVTRSLNSLSKSHAFSLNNCNVVYICCLFVTIYMCTDLLVNGCVYRRVQEGWTFGSCPQRKWGQVDVSADPPQCQLPCQWWTKGRLFTVLFSQGGGVVVPQMYCPVIESESEIFY